MLTIYGIHPVTEALERGDSEIERIIIARGRRGRDVRQIEDMASLQGIPLFREDGSVIDELTGSRSHQGICLMLRKFQYAALDEMLALPHESTGQRLVLILDCIEDPQNVGSLIRTAHCFGVSGIIIPEDRSASVTAAVIKASAGAALHTPITRVVNISKVIDRLQKEGFWIYGADAQAGSSFDAFDYEGSIGLVMGSEQRGIRPLVKKKCDYLISVPMTGSLDSLNVSVAAGILMHHIARRKRCI